MKKFFTSLFALLLCIASYADEVVYDFSASIPNGWTASEAPNGFETTNTARGCQFTKDAVLTLKGAKGVTKVVVVCSANVGATVNASVGGALWGSETIAKITDASLTFTGSAADGDLTVSLTRDNKSIWIKTITVTCSESVDPGQGGGGEDGSDLDPAYTYAEPTVVGPSGATGNNASYSFIQNNIEVKTTTGAQAETYFGCNATASITFTATKPIKALVINGYVKKDFSAECNHGDIAYVDASEDYVEADPVLAITDIDATSVTINCDKQLRCYSVSFYFNENPEVDLDTPGTGGDYEGDFNFDYEPIEVTTINATMDYLSCEDYSSYYGYDYVDIYMENDEASIELGVFTPAVAGTCVAPGTYVINDTFESGTVQASPGGDDMYDYPSMYMTDYEEYDGAYYYNTCYYMESGTLTVTSDPAGVKMVINAKTHFGSTINATFVGEAEFFGDMPDGIKEVEGSRAADGCYDLQGRRLTDMPVKGIYIKNGKKMLK